MKKNLTLACIFISCVFSVNGQSTSDDLERMRQLAIKNEQIAKANELKAKEAEISAKQAEDRVRILERENKMMRETAIANELAERSIEIEDKQLSALLAVQAHNFNVNNGGYMSRTKMYSALINALKKNDLVPNDSEAAKTFLKSTNNRPIFSAALPNSQNSVIAEKNGNLKFITEQGIVVRVLAGHRAQVDQITFSNSGKLMATSGKDNSIRIWDLNQLNLRPIVIILGGKVSKLSFSVDDKQLMYALGAKSVTFKQQPVDMKLMAADLCKVLIRNLTNEEWSVYVSTDLPYEQTCPKN